MRRLGEELRVARMSIGMSARTLGALVGISHTEVLRIERGLAPHVSVDTVARIAAVLGHDLSLAIHPLGSAVRDIGHLALLKLFAARLAASITWRTEVPIPLPGDPRSADGVAAGMNVDAVVEAETRLDDVQAVVRRLRAKQRDLGTTRAILLVADTRHNRDVIREVQALREEFPVPPRACLLALGRDDDPGGDCLLMM
jgi:transcriptional regulator with XRE-family HTH domain